MAENDLLQRFGLQEAQNFVNTGKTSSKELDQTVAATDFVQRSVATGKTFEEIMDSAQALSAPIQQKIAENLKTAAEDRPLTGSQLVASAVLQIAPILIGAAVSGKKGAGVGARAGFGGSTSFTKSMEASNQSQKQTALANVKVLQGQLDSLSKQQVGAQEGIIKQDNAMEMAEFKREASKSVAQMQNKMKQMENEDLPDDLKKALVAIAEGKLVSGEERAKALSSPKNAKLLLEAERLRNSQEAVRGTGNRFNTKLSREEQSMHVAGTARVPGAGVDLPSKRTVSKMTSEKNETMVVLDKLINGLKKNGQEFWGKNKGEMATYAALLQSSMRKLAGTGANLTAPEIPYLKNVLAKVPGTEDMTSVLITELFEGGALNKLQALKNTLNESYAESLLGYDYYVPNNPNLYREETIALFPFIAEPYNKTPDSSAIQIPKAGQSSGEITATGADGSKLVLRNNKWEKM